MGFQDAPSGGGGKLSLASVGFAGAGVRTGGTGGGCKELLVMALPMDDGLDGAKVAQLIGAGLPDIGGSVMVRTSLLSEFIIKVAVGY
jgi:solute carrier family 25 phosphate transporter 23/24/25/41